jgi:AAA+ ATPase superfamily predicted ATPase
LKDKGPFSSENCEQLELNPLKFESLKSFFPEYSIHDQVYCYAALGGLPGYLRLFDKKKTLEQNMKSEIFSKDSALFREPSLLLQSRLREPSLYFSILHAIAVGKNRLHEISEKTGIREIATLNKYLYVLRNHYFIKRIVPVTEEDSLKSRKGMYFFLDPYFRFWFRYVFPNMSYLEIEEKDVVWRQLLKTGSDNFIGDTFVDICIERLRRLNRYKRLPFEAERIGRWWDRQEKIDIVAMTNDGDYLFCDCLWDGKRAGLVQLNELMRKAQRCTETGRKYFGFFSKTGFTKELSDHARENDNVLLIDYY